MNKQTRQTDFGMLRRAGFAFYVLALVRLRDGRDFDDVAKLLNSERSGTYCLNARHFHETAFAAYLTGYLQACTKFEVKKSYLVNCTY